MMDFEAAVRLIINKPDNIPMSEIPNGLLNRIDIALREAYETGREDTKKECIEVVESANPYTDTDMIEEIKKL